MRRMIVFAVLFLAACGGAAAGDPCDQSGFLCHDKSSALECRSGHWESLPCRGAAGCERSGDTVKCDMSGNLVGDACASSAEGKGLCGTNGTSTLECQSGQLVQTNSCQTCSVSNGQVVCQQ